MTETLESVGMTLARLADSWRPYGADPARWPPTERDAASRLLERSPGARNLRSRTDALDDLLTTSVAPAPNRDCASPFSRCWRRGLLLGLRDAAVSALAGELGGLRPAGAVVGIALLLGVMVGGALGVDAGNEIAASEAIDIVDLAYLDEGSGLTGY